MTGSSLAFWLPFPDALPSMSGIAFYVNVFAAARTNLSWKIPLTLGLCGLAYLTLIRNGVEGLEYTWTTSILMIIVLVLTYAGGKALYYAADRVKQERETGQERVLNLQVSLARELHDSVAQTLSSAAMRANIVMGDPTLSSLAKDQLERIADECRSSAHDLRQLLSALRDEPERTLAPGPLADIESLRTAVHSQADRLRAEGFSVTVTVDITKLSAARCQTLAAVAVEAGNNIMKHAQRESSCSLSIVQDTEDVVGEFSNIRGNSRALRRGFGLTGVQERLALLNGTSRSTVRGNRWILQVRLPLGLESSTSSANPPHSIETVFPEEATF